METQRVKRLWTQFIHKKRHYVVLFWVRLDESRVLRCLDITYLVAFGRVGRASIIRN